MIKPFILIINSFDEFKEFENLALNKRFGIQYLSGVLDNGTVVESIRVKVYKGYPNENVPCEEVSLQDNYGRAMYYINQVERKEKGGYKIPHLKFLV